MSFYPASPRIASAPGLLTVCLLVGLSACQRPVAYFQRSPRMVFQSPAPKPGASQSVNVPTDSIVNPGSNPVQTGQAVPGKPERTQPVRRCGGFARQPVVYAEASRPIGPASQPVNSPARSLYPVAERIEHHQDNARRLLTPAPDTEASLPVSEHQPGPKPRKTLREILGLPPRKKLNWWQRISWQLKASIVVILIAVVFAILNITVLAIIFGVIGALLLIRGLKKSFKVRRGIFGLGR